MNKHDVTKGVEVTFADGKDRLIRPLTIRQLRKFVKLITKMDQEKFGAGMSDEDIDVMMDAAALILEKVDAELASNREDLEDAIDLHTFSRLMDIAMGQASPEE